MDDQKKKNIKRIILITLVILLCLKIYSIYSDIVLIQGINSMGLQYGMENYFSYNDKVSFPDFAKRFVPDKNLKDDLFAFCVRYNKLNKNIAGNNKSEIEEYIKYYDTVKNKVSINLEDYENDLIPEIKTFLYKEKTFTFPPFEEKKKLLPAKDRKDYDNLSEYWILVSKIFEEKNDYNSSLILRYGIIYLLYDFEINYSNSIDPLDELDLVEYACKSMLQWASEPKPEAIELSKTISKDLLNFVANDYKFSQYIEYRKNSLLFEIDYCIANNSDYRSQLKKFKNSYILKEAMNFIYDEPLKYVDKPVSEIEDKLESYKKKLKESKDLYKKSSNFFHIFSPSFLINPENTIYLTIIYNYGFNIDYLKKTYEHKLAYMEFTAIALALNAYYSENNMMPESIDDLNSWLGYDLPKNRFTNKNYEINKKNPVLFNEGICPEYPNPEFFVDIFCLDKNDENERKTTYEWLEKRTKEIAFYFLPIKSDKSD